MKLNKIMLLMAAPIMLVACGGGEDAVSSASKKPTSKDEESVSLPTVERTPGAYSAIVTDMAGAPITKCKVAWCIEEEGGSCTIPVKVDATGYAEDVNVTPGNYLTHLSGYDKKYTYNPNGYPVTPTMRQVEIKMSEIKEYGEGAGTISSPYSVSEGAYGASMKQDEIVYVKFSAPAATYKIESWQAQIGTVLSVAEYAEDGSVIANGTGGLLNGNFTYAFDIKEGESKILGVKLDKNPWASGNPFDFQFAFTPAN